MLVRYILSFDLMFWSEWLFFLEACHIEGWLHGSKWWSSFWTLTLKYCKARYCYRKNTEKLNKTADILYSNIEQNYETSGNEHLARPWLEYNAPDEEAWRIFIHYTDNNTWKDEKEGENRFLNRNAIYVIKYKCHSDKELFYESTFEHLIRNI